VGTSFAEQKLVAQFWAATQNLFDVSKHVLVGGKVVELALHVAGYARSGGSFVTQ
jgi:hypothetical protein